MALDQFETRRDALFEAIAAEQRLPAAAIAQSMGRYPESVLGLLICLHDESGQQGFDEGFRLVDLLQNLGCVDLVVPHPEMLDPVVLAGRLGEGGPFQLSVPRSGLNLERTDLLRLLKQRLGIERPTRQTAYVRPAAKGAAAAAGAPARAPVPAGAANEVGLAGKLHQMPIEDLVQIFQLQRRSGVLKLSAGDSSEALRGSIGFQDGSVVDARAGDLEGEDAFFALAALIDGDFRLADAVPPAHTIDRPTPQLLMEALRLKDEAQRRG